MKGDNLKDQNIHISSSMSIKLGIRSIPDSLFATLQHNEPEWSRTHSTPKLLSNNVAGEQIDDGNGDDGGGVVALLFSIVSTECKEKVVLSKKKQRWVFS